MSEPTPHESASPSLLWGVVALLGLTGLLIVALTAPLATLAGPSQYAIRGALHGTVAGLFMVTATVGVFQAYRILVGKAWSTVELQVGSVINATLALLTIVSGNWIYIPYRAAEGPRSHFLQHVPEVHKVFFEFKEFAALFTLPLAVTAAYLLVRYGTGISQHRGLRAIVAILLLLVFFYFVVAFGLGAAITKLRSV